MSSSVVSSSELVSNFRPFKLSENIFFSEYQAEHDAFRQEIEHYLRRYPNTQHVDICLHDINGHVRGKRIDVSSLEGLLKNCYFPLSIYAMSLDGKVIEETGIGKFIGEPDYPCKPILGSLQPSPSNPELSAQLYLTMQDNDGQDCMYEPRNILKNTLKQFHEKQMFPVMAAELEFYLFKTDDDGTGEVLTSQCFDINTCDDYQNIISEVEHIAKIQGINITGVVSESSSGQFEINIKHTDDLLLLCDQILSLKRIIKKISKKHQFSATFLAKPEMYKSGSGMHFHMSVYDQNKNNIFSSNSPEKISEKLLKSISGMIMLLPDSMAILAPNMNSFRRFKIGQHVPMEANWGVNNRNVAIRIPCSDIDNQRLEYRVPGADCNPYLTVSMILIGALYGVINNFDVPKQANQLKFQKEHIFLPNNQLEALNLFKKNKVIQHYLGSDFVDLWYTVKLAEYNNIYSQITTIEQGWDI